MQYIITHFKKAFKLKHDMNVTYDIDKSHLYTNVMKKIVAIRKQMGLFFFENVPFGQVQMIVHVRYKISHKAR